MRDRLVGLTLGWRWFRRPAPANQPLRARRIAAAACAVFVAVLGATLWQANADREARGQAQQPRPSSAEDSTFEVRQTDTPYDGDVWTTVFMSGSADAPAPPGLPEFPSPGATYVSPAVEVAMGTDPSLAARVPGTVIGTVGTPGLQSPDQYFVYAGAEPGAHWRHAKGWGSDVVAVARPSVPSLALLGLIAILMGLPALMLARATGRMSAVTRQRSLAACHLLGIPSRALVTASATDAALCGLVGGVAGSIGAAVAVLLVHDSTLLGIAWFPKAMLISPTVLVVSIVGLATLVALDAAKSTRKDLRNPIAGRAGSPRPLRTWTATPLFVGILGLASIVATSHLLGIHVPPAWAITYFFVGGVATTIAALAGLPVLVAGISRRLRLWSGRSAATFVAVRRLSWQRDSIASAAVGIVVVAISGLVAAGALADLKALSPEHPEGDRYAVQGLAGTELAEALDVPAPARMLQVSDGPRTTNVAECPMLVEFVELSHPGAGESFRDQCEPGMTFRLATQGSPGPDRIVIPGLLDSAMRGSTMVALDPSTPPDLKGQHDIIAYPGPHQSDVDEYIGAVVAVAHQAEVSNLTADPYKPMVPPTQHLLIVCMLFGLLTAAALLVLTSLDAHRRARADGARLVAIGASQSFAARVHTLTYALGVAVALGVGVLIGGLNATVYDIAGGLVPHPGGIGLLLALIAVLVTAAATIGTWLTVRRAHHGTLVDDMRFE